MTTTLLETRTVWHPTYHPDEDERYRNVPCSDADLERYGLYYDRFGMLRERRGTAELDNEWGAEVSVCAFGPGACGRMWSDPREAHCVGCHRHFGGDKGAEMHLLEAGCADPVGVKHLEVVERKFGPTWVRSDHMDNPGRYE
jgi:hypothetical protein